MKDLKDKPSIVFGYFVDDVFKGFRADSFGTLSLKQPKIYKYSKKQIETIKKNTQYELSKQGTSFFKMLFKKGFTPVNTQNEILEKDIVIQKVSDSENEKKAWGEFEVRVLSFPYEYEDIEDWKMEAFVKNLPESLETLKFKSLEDYESN